VAGTAGVRYRDILEVREEMTGHASSSGAGDEPFAVEHRGHDPPAQAVDEQQCGSEDEGGAECHLDRADTIHAERRPAISESAERIVGERSFGVCSVVSCSSASLSTLTTSRPITTVAS
jgi:hypothetical protein